MSYPQVPSSHMVSDQHRYFVSKYSGTFVNETEAIAAAELPANSLFQEDFATVDGAKLLAFRAPPGSTDTKGFEVLILQPAGKGAYHLWQSATDLARATRDEASDDVQIFKELIQQEFRIFERM